jgi:hypothetical protein
MVFKAFFSAVAIALTLMAFGPYIRDILRGNIKPHVFSWVIWELTTFIVFLAQMQAKGGGGACPIGIKPRSIQLFCYHLKNIRKFPANLPFGVFVQKFSASPSLGKHQFPTH